MKKLIVILFLLVALSGLGAISGGTARSDRTVTIPAGGGAITNIVWQSNTRYVLDSGTNTVSTYPNGANNVNNPHLLIRDKTNIVIEGLGPNSAVFTAQTGTVFTAFNCYGIKFKNFSLTGTRGPANGFNFGSQFAGIELRGTNQMIEVDGVVFDNHSDQGISGNLNNDGFFTTNAIIKNCIFRNIGTTNGDFGFGLVRDGAAIVPVGPNWTIKDCRFEDNLRDVEPFNLTQAGMSNLFGLKVIDNTMLRPKETSIYASSVPGIRDCDIRGNTIIFDPAMRDGTYDNHIGIGLTDCRDIRIVGNNIQNAEYPFYILITSGAQESANSIIQGNQFSRNLHGGFLSSTTGTNAGWIVAENTFAYNTSEAMRIGGFCNQIINNTFNRNGTIFGGATLKLEVLGGAVGSNVISGNLFWSDNQFTAASPTHCITIASGANFNTVINNRFGDYSTAPYSDSGNNNVWVGNLLNNNSIQLQPAASVNAVATAANTTETDLASYTLPGNSLLVTNQAIEFQAWGSFGATANNKVVRVKYGGAAASNVLLDTLLRANNAQEWMLSGTIQRVNATTLKAATRFEVAGFVTNDIVTLTMDPTTNAIFRITGSNTVAAASDIGLDGWKVAWKP